MQTLTARSKISEALQALCTEYPLFANIALSWDLVEHADFDTMATNGPTLFYNAQFVLDLTIAEATWVLLHEAGHIFLGHHLRLIGSNPEQANIAFDLALNSLIKWSCPTQKLREMVLIPGRNKYASLPVDRDAEFYYAELFTKQPEPPKEQEQGQQEQEQEQDSDKGQGSAQEQGEEQGQGQGEEQDSAQGEAGAGDSDASGNDSSEDSESGDATQGQSGQGQGSQNSSKGQPDAPKGQSKAQSGMGGVLPLPDALTPEDRTAAEAEWKETVAESMEIAESCGALPGWLKDIGESLLGKSVIDWRTILRRFLTKTVPQRATYTRVNRRSAWRTDFRLPARRSKGGADGLIIADVSGSIFSTIKDQVLPEIDTILRTLSRSSVRLMQIDTRIASDETYTRYDLPLQLDIQGGGGTDLSPAFEAAQEDPELRWIVVITDMEWSYASAPKVRIPTLWIVVNNPTFKGKLPFGELVSVS